MSVVAMTYLLEAGVHFGHQTKRWNPKMGEYIFSQREGIHIIDLQKTNIKIEEAYAEFKKIAEAGGKFLFVGTKKQAQVPIQEEAKRANMYYVTERWLGGTLTNFGTIRKRVNRLELIEKMEKDGTFEKLPKKEVIGLKKEYERLVRYFGGIREMTRTPQALFVVDPKAEEIAIAEARKLNIPVFGIVDTNCDPDLVDYIIPGNDDAVRAVKLITGVLVNAIVEVNGGTLIDYVTEPERAPRPRVDHTERAPRPRVDRTERALRPAVETKEVKPASPKVIEETVAAVEPKPALEKVEKEEAKKVTKSVKKEVVKADYSKMTVTELKAIAKEQAISGYSKMKKDELLTVLK